MTTYCILHCEEEPRYRLICWHATRRFMMMTPTLQCMPSGIVPVSMYPVDAIYSTNAAEDIIPGLSEATTTVS